MSNKTNYTLTNESNHPLVEKVLNCIGRKVILIDSYDDEFDREYEFPDEVMDIGVIGDDAIGAVTGAYMLNDNLILIANYGDDGEYEYNVNNSTKSNPLGIVKLAMLNDEDETPTPPELSKEQMELIAGVITAERENTGSFMADGHNDEGLQKYYKELQDAEFVLTEASK